MSIYEDGGQAVLSTRERDPSPAEQLVRELRSALLRQHIYGKLLDDYVVSLGKRAEAFVDHAPALADRLRDLLSPTIDEERVGSWVEVHWLDIDDARTALAAYDASLAARPEK